MTTLLSSRSLRGYIDFYGGGYKEELISGSKSSVARAEGGEGATNGVGCHDA